jgi:hypothetical protein
VKWGSQEELSVAARVGSKATKSLPSIDIDIGELSILLAVTVAHELTIIRQSSFL